MPVTREISSGLGHRALGVIPALSVVVGGVALCMMIILVLAGVTARAVFNFALPFAIEYSEYLIPVIALWGAAYALREGAHVNADMLIHRLSDKSRQWVILIGYVLGLGYLILLTIHTLGLSLTSIKLHYTSMYPTETLYGYWQLMVPIGVSLFAFQLVGEIIIKARLLYLSYR